MSSDHDVPQWPAAKPVDWPGSPPVAPVGGFGPSGWPAASPVGVRRFQPVSQLGDASIVLVCLTALAMVGSTAADWNTYLVSRNHSGDAPTVAAADLSQADLLSAVMAIPLLGLLVMSGVVFLWWLWRARANAELLCHTAHRRSRGWVIGAWVCPVVNLWFPKQIVDDIWRASDPHHPSTASTFHADGGPTSGLVHLWWWTWIMSNIIQFWGGGSERTVSLLRTAAIVSTVSTLLSIVAAVALVLIIQRLTTWQNTPRQPIWQAGSAAPVY